MYVRVLGPVTVGRDDSDLTEAPGSVVAAVVAQLALARGRTVGVDELADRVWDIPPDNPRNAIQAAVSRARRAYAPGLIVSSGSGYRLGPAVDVDLRQAEELLAGARRVAGTDPASAAEQADAALALFVGTPLDGQQSHAAMSARAALSELRLAIVLVLGDALVLDGRAAVAVPVLREEIAQRPLVEPLHAALMRALGAAGRSSEAVDHYGELRRRIADELGTDPSSEVVQTFEDLLAGRDVLVRARARVAAPGAVRPRILLPPQRHLPVGRETDIAAIDAMLSAERVVTLVGLGGVGKTTLALAVARRCSEDGTRDVVLVRADGATGADSVLADVSRSWGGDGSPEAAASAVRASLAGRPGLLVLDSCEDLDLTRVVEQLLDDVAGLSVLATSRKPLAVAGETVVQVHGLQPEAARTLFALRARQVGVVELETEVARRLVAAVDGSPLGVELLAGRLADVAPSQLLAEVETSRGARPMDDVVDWSRGRLSGPATVLLDHLADLPDGVGADLARHLVGTHAPGALTELVHSGLVHRFDVARTVWRSPEMVRGHVRAGASQSRTRRASDALDHFVLVHKRGFHGFLRVADNDGDVLSERANVATTLEASHPAPDDAARMILLLMAVDHELGISDPAVADMALAVAGDASPSLRGWLLAVHARRLHRENRPEASLAVCDDVCAQAGALGDAALGAIAHGAATFALLAAGRNEEALARVELAVADAEIAYDPVTGINPADPRLSIGTLRLRAGCLDVAGASQDDVASAYDLALRRARAAGRPDLVLTDLCTWAAHQGMDVLAESAAAELRAVAGTDRPYTLAHADISDAVRAWHRGDATRLVLHTRDALDRFRGSGDARWIGVCLWLFAEAASLRGDDPAAARLLGARVAVQGEADVDPDAIALIDRVRGSVGDRWTALEREGRLLSLDDAVVLVPA